MKKLCIVIPVHLKKSESDSPDLYKRMFYSLRTGMSSAELNVPKFDISFDTPNRERFLRDEFHKNRDSYAILGRGSYGVVIKATYRGRPVAVKILEKRSCHRSSHNTLLNEANALYVRHDNIVTVLKIVSGTKYGLVLMERFDGHCLQRILDNQSILPIPLLHKLLILCDVINGLCFCHLHRLVHLDVKPENVIVMMNTSTSLNNIPVENIFRVRKYLCKLCDFGSSMKLASWKSNEPLANRGTIRYMSPELLCGQHSSANGVYERSDIYSFGVTMWQLYEERFPYEEIKCNEVIAYNVVKKGLRPNSITAITDTLGNQPINRIVPERCWHWSFLSLASIATVRALDARFNSEAVEHALQRQGIVIESIKKEQEIKNLPFSAIPSKGDETDMAALRISKLFFDNSRTPNHQCIRVCHMVETLYSKCWVTDPASRPNAVTVRNTIHVALERFAHCKCGQ